MNRLTTFSHLKRWILLILYPITLNLLNCGEEPNPVGVKTYHGPIGKVMEMDTVFTVTQAKAFNYRIGTGYFDQIAVGSYQNIESRTLIQFDIPDSGAIIQDVTILFHGSRALFEGPGTSFDIVFSKMNSDASGDWKNTVNVDVTSLPDLNLKFDPTEIARMTVDTSATSQDSVSSDPELTSLFQTWTDNPTTNKNNGLIMSFQGTTGFAKLFWSGNNTTGDSTFPTVRIRYSNPSELIADTTQTFPLLGDATHFVNSYSYESNTLFVTSGTATRSWLKFDVSFLPQNATVHRANLILHEKTSLSRRVAGSKLVRAIRYADEIPANPETMTTDNNISSVGGTQIADSVILDISRYVQDWTQNSTARYPNHGVMLYLSPESVYLMDRLAFYANAASDLSNTSKLPKLKIYYSIPK